MMMAVRCVWIALVLLVGALPAAAEYCVTWSTVLQKHTGSPGHCWPTESECKAYYNSRSLSHPVDFGYGQQCGYRPGLYPPTGAQKPAAPNGAAEASKAQAEAQQLKAKQAAEAAAREKAFKAVQKDLLQGNKGDVSASAGLTIKPPPTPGTALQDLGRIQQESDRAVKGSDQWEKVRSGDWENAPPAATALPAVPAVPAPTAVDEAAIPKDPAALRQFLAALAQQIGTTRKTLAQQEAQVAQLEQVVAREQQGSATLSGLKPVDESDALKRAREALAKARAARQATAAQLQRLEQQEKEASTDH